MNTFQQRIQTKTKGFTIVELLIVIVVIAILAAISVVAYSGIQNRTHDSAIQQDLRNFGVQTELYHAIHGVYPFDVRVDFAGDFEVTFTHNAYSTTGRVFNLLYCRTNAGRSSVTEYALLAVSQSGNQYYISNTSGVTEYTGSSGWVGSGASEICRTVLSESVYGGATGWRNNDGWRDWAS